MKTKKIPFNIEKAKAGAKIVTRGGLPVKIVDYPIKNEEYPILGLVLIEGKEIPLLFTKTGNHYNNSESCYDLFIEEEVEEDDSDYDPYKSTVESLADMVERYSELQTLEELKHFYNNVKVKCREAIEYDSTWNKKQDEQKTKIEPKFKVGDWIVQDNAGIYKVTEICESWYEVIDSYELHYSIDFDQESMCHLWSIQEARPGDVLAIGWKDEHGHDWQKIVIFKSLTEFSVEGYGNTFKNNELAFEDEVPFYSKTWSRFLHPATKEQRDILFQKMKELKKIDVDMAEKKIKTRKMTYKELSWWLREHPEEHREYTHEDIRKSSSNVYSCYDYNTSYADEEVNEYIRIRKNGGEWQEPIIQD